MSDFTIPLPREMVPITAHGELHVASKLVERVYSNGGYDHGAVARFLTRLARAMPGSYAPSITVELANETPGYLTGDFESRIVITVAGTACVTPNTWGKPKIAEIVDVLVSEPLGRRERHDSIDFEIDTRIPMMYPPRRYANADRRIRGGRRDRLATLVDDLTKAVNTRTGEPVQGLHTHAQLYALPA